MFNFFKKPAPKVVADEADPQDLKRAAYIQQKGQIGAMFAERLKDPLENQAEQQARYEHVLEELLGVLDQIEDEFSRGFGSHQLIKMCMIADDKAVCQALLVGVRDHFLREQILKSFPSLARP